MCCIREPGDTGEAVWSDVELRSLIELYLYRFDIPTIALLLARKPVEVVQKLGEKLLDCPKAFPDRSAPAFGRIWSSQDDDLLRFGYQANWSIRDIARRLQRDQLAVVFRIINKVWPPIPKPVLDELSLDTGRFWSVEIDKPAENFGPLADLRGKQVRFCGCIENAYCGHEPF